MSAAGFWRERRAHLLEAFLVLNLAALTGDIALAHAVNGFARRAEWVPLAFSAVCGLVLVPLTARSWRRRSLALGRGAVCAFGVVAVAVGLVGLGLHLESQFLRERTLKHLVYTAPFAAPLAYAGLGSLLVMNRRYAGDPGWAFAVLFGALGGFFGNFVLTLCDHAQNGFYRPAEWVAVATAALATGFLAALVLLGGRPRRFVAWVGAVLALQGVVGGAGFAFHAWANWQARTLIHGAPVLAPLLFVNIGVLAAFGLIDLLVEGGGDGVPQP